MGCQTNGYKTAFGLQSFDGFAWQVLVRIPRYERIISFKGPCQSQLKQFHPEVCSTLRAPPGERHGTMPAVCVRRTSPDSLSGSMLPHTCPMDAVPQVPEAKSLRKKKKSRKTIPLKEISASIFFFFAHRAIIAHWSETKPIYLCFCVVVPLLWVGQRGE